MPIIEGIVKPVSDGVQKIVDYIKGVGTQTGGWLDYVSQIKELFVGHVLPTVSRVWETVWDIVGKVGQWLSNSVLIKDIFGILTGFTGKMYDAIAWIADKIKWLFDNVIMPMLDKIEKAYKWIKELTGNGSMVQVRTGTFSIAPPKIPGTPDNTGGGTGGNGGAGGGRGNSGSKTANNISTGGSKTTHVTFNLGNLVHTMNVTAATVKESAEKIRDIVQDEMVRGLSMAKANI
jgi:hypothetical protein